MSLETRQCVVCGKEFQTDHGTKETCSKECSLENMRRWRKVNAAAKWRETHPVEQKACPVCGALFVPVHGRKYCGKKCLTKAFLGTEKGREYKRRKDKRYMLGGADGSKREERRLQTNANSNARYEKQRRAAGVPLAEEVGRQKDGTFPYVNGAARYRLVQRDRRRMTEQRRVWEDANGPLPEGLYVHHINGCKKDNRIENLQAMTPLQHNRLHAQLRKQQKQEVTDGFMW